jgi:hypothetical protein
LARVMWAGVSLSFYSQELPPLTGETQLIMDQQRRRRPADQQKPPTKKATEPSRIGALRLILPTTTTTRSRRPSAIGAI